MRTMLAVLGVLLAGSASAKPLPGGIKVIAKAGRPFVQQGQTLVPLRDDDLADYEKITKAELAADGKTIEVTSTRCQGSLTDDVTRIPLAKVQARLDNALGLVAHGKKQYAAAIAKFTSALQKDPETPSYATNLVAAQLLGKKATLAGQTLSIQGKKNPIWFAWRIATDADLAGTKTLKVAQDLVAAKAGTATLATLGARDLATSTLGGGMAALRTLGNGAPGTSDVDVVSLTSGRLLARLPIITTEDACDDTADHPCDDAAVARIADRTKLVDSLFASLGFDIVASALVDVRNGDPVTKNGVTVDVNDDSIVASRGSDERTLPIDGSAWFVAFTPKAIVVKLVRRNLTSCNDGSSRTVGIALVLP